MIKAFEESFILSNAEAGAITFSCWDFGGQRVFQSVQHLLLSRLGVYAVVFDMRKLVLGTKIGDKVVTSDTVTACIDYIQFWLRQIQLLALGAPVFLIGTRLDVIHDQQSHEEISDLLVSKLRPGLETLWVYISLNGSLCFYPVSNMRNNEADESRFKSLRGLIDQAAENDPAGYVNDPIPLSWLKVCDEFRKLTRNNVPYLYRRRSEHSAATTELNLTDMCARFGVFNGLESTEEKDARVDTMLAMFHKLGVAVYFKETGLDNIIILDPQWVIDVIVSIIRDYDMHPLERDKKFKLHYRPHWNNLRQNGVLAATMLRSFWSEEGDKIPFLLQLMKQLGLMCELPNPNPEIFEQQYLVPSVLMVDKGVQESAIGPSNVKQLSLGHQQILESHFVNTSRIVFKDMTYVPEGFLSRLIVDLASKCEKIELLEYLKVAIPSVFTDSVGNLNAAIRLGQSTFLLIQRADCISVGVLESGSSDIFQELQASCDRVISSFYKTLAAVVEAPKATLFVPLDVEGLDDETDEESISTATTSKKIDNLKIEEEILTECVDPMCNWLKSIGIKSDQKIRNIATTLCSSAWDDKEKIVTFFERGVITKDDIAKWFTITGDRECFIHALDQEVSKRRVQLKPINDTHIGPSTDTADDTSKHTMMSYSHFQQDIVKLFTDNLRLKGHDVWMDVDGSRILGSMSVLGGTNVGMAKAVESSHSGVICVSKEYLKSRNCMKEINYLDLRGIENLIFVMMEKGLEPKHLCGPLPLIMGTSLYYKLTEKSEMESVCRDVSDRLLASKSSAYPSVGRSVNPSLVASSSTDPTSAGLSSTDPTSAGLSSTDPTSTGLSSTDPTSAAHLQFIMTPEPLVSPTAASANTIRKDSISPSRLTGEATVVESGKFEGWLTKRSEWVRDWRPRYFVLENRNLSFAKSELGASHGCIVCSSIRTVKDPKSPSSNNIIIRSTVGKEIYLRADSPEDEARWVQAIKNSISSSKISSGKK